MSVETLGEVAPSSHCAQPVARSRDTAPETRFDERPPSPRREPTTAAPASTRFPAPPSAAPWRPDPSPFTFATTRSVLFFEAVCLAAIAAYFVIGLGALFIE